MSTRKPEQRIKAISLRKQGYSYNEISEKLNIAKSTCSVWLRNVKLEEKAIYRLANREDQGRANAAFTLRQYRKERDKFIAQKVAKTLKNFSLTPAMGKLLCATLYWAEGGKSESALYFSNSDPSMIGVYMNLLRKYFSVDERKFGAILHLHEYHDVNKQKQFWSKITHIPVKRISIYIKPNSGKRSRINYPGCISVRYYDVRLAKEIEFLYTALGKQSGGVV